MLSKIFRVRAFMRAVLPLILIALGLTVVGAKAETANYEVYEDEAAFYAELKPDTITVVDFDNYPDGTPVPTGYDPSGNWSGFEIMGDEWSPLGVTFFTPSGQPMSTVNITEFPQGTIWYNYSSPPNSLTPGQPPYVGYGVPHDPDTGDPLYISFDPPRWAVGLVFIDNSPSGDGEHVEFRAADGSVIADLPSPVTGYLSFLGIVSDVPIAVVEVFEEKYDGDDVSYDDIVYGMPAGQAVEATIEINPETLNLKNEGEWITVYIELPDGYDIVDIGVGTVTLEGTFPAESHPTEIGDYDNDGIPDLMVKFDRQTLIEYLEGTTGEVMLTVSGELNDGTPFEGSDTITVTNPGQKDHATPPCGWTQTATIVLDGNSNDWAELDCFSDPTGDNVGGSAYDISKVCTAIDDNYAYLMVETSGKPFTTDATVEINFDYKPGQHIAHSSEAFADLHTNIWTDNTFHAWTDEDLDGNIEEFPISGYSIVRADVLEGSIPLSELEDTYYFNATFANIWESGIGQPGNDPTNICIE